MKKWNININSNFNSLNDYFKFIENETNNLSSYNANTFQRTFNDEKVNYNLRWYGKESLDEIKNIKQFSYPEIYMNIKNIINEQLDSKMFSKIKKKKIEFNENVGIFSFDRVVMSMQRKNELFCKQINKVVEWSDVNVLEDKSIVTKNEKYKVQIRFAKNENGKPKIKTSNKKIFVYFPQKARKRTAVEIFLGNSLSANINSENAIYKSIPSIIIAEELIKKGYKVKINYVFGSADKGNICIGIVPIKNYNEPIDNDKLLMMTCDMAFVRYHSYKSIVSIFNYFEKNIDNTLGSPIYNDLLGKIANGNGFPDAEYYDIDKHFNPETTKLFIPESWNEKDAIKQIKETINQLANEN